MKIVATPRQRFVLATLLLHRDLKFKTRKQDRDLYRARVSLGLIGVTETLLEYKRVNDAYANDRATLHAFDVSDDSAALLVSCREQLDVTGFDSMVLAPLFDQLEGNESPLAPPAFDESSELPRWKPSNLPVLEGPDRFYVVLEHTLRTTDSYSAWKDAMLAALTPEDPKWNARC